MENYYTVVNAASRLNCNRQTILRAIKDGTFTDAIRDYSIPGHPAWMVPSNQVEWWKDHDGILKRRSRKTGQAAGGVAKMLIHKDDKIAETDPTKLGEMQKEVDDMLSDESHLTINEMYAQITRYPHTDSEMIRGMDTPNDSGKILIEIDASTIQKSVNDQFRRQIMNLREAVSLINDELAKLEAML